MEIKLRCKATLKCTKDDPYIIEIDVPSNAGVPILETHEYTPVCETHKYIPTLKRGQVCILEPEDCDAIAEFMYEVGKQIRLHGGV